METIIFKGPMGQTGGYIDSSTITDSNIDMNDKKITTLMDPTDPQDAVNLRSMTSFIGSGFSVYTVSLTAQNYTSFSTLTKGAYTISVNGISDGMPCGIFHISKSEPSKIINAQRMSSSSGQTTDERLFIRWLANSYPELYKDGINHDGNYTIKIY